MLPRQPLRFLLADDPGAGKTIMAGLLIKELKARGLITRTLIEKLVTRLDGIHILSTKRHQEHEPGFERIHGYDFLRVRFEPLRTTR